MTTLYHVFNKSISNLKIFNTEQDYQRFKIALNYYKFQEPHSLSFNIYISQKHPSRLLNQPEEKIIELISYVIMPNHFHLLLSDMGKPENLSHYLNNILNSYTRYFNIKYDRKGPLWQSRTKKIFIKNEIYLLHLTRYIHLNPTIAYITENPSEWKYSSYGEFIGISKEKICDFQNYLSIKPQNYKEFVEDNISFQRELKKIKELIIE